ncbi:hypothetical protein Q8A73_011497 [Channa argus]|nr:hypothetical protein Q8A73_011497 [Channa argus]
MVSRKETEGENRKTERMRKRELSRAREVAKKAQTHTQQVEWRVETRDRDKGMVRGESQDMRELSIVASAPAARKKQQRNLNVISGVEPRRFPDSSEPLLRLLFAIPSNIYQHSSPRPTALLEMILTGGKKLNTSAEWRKQTRTLWELIKTSQEGNWAHQLEHFNTKPHFLLLFDFMGSWQQEYQ